MSPEIMGAQVDTDYLPCFVYNSPHCCVRYSKDPLVRPNSFGMNIFLETVGDLLGNKDNLPFLPTFGTSES
jgi:hypothetical protein